MPSLTLARTGQISEPQECGPGTRITTTGSGYVEWTSGTLADVRNGVATWQRWPGGSAGDYCDTLRRLVFRGVASGSGFVVTWDEGKADPGPEGVYWQEQASSGSPIDAREFGVKADGVTDDTAALVAAFASSGAAVALPAGTIRVRGSGAAILAIASGKTVIGQGMGRTIVAVEFTDANAGAAVSITGSGVVFRDWTLQVEGAATTQSSVRFNATSSGHRFENFEIDGSPSFNGTYTNLVQGISFDDNASVTDVVLQGCKIHDVQYGLFTSNAYAGDANDWTISACSFYNNTADDLEFNVLDSTTQRWSRVRVVACSFYGWKGDPNLATGGFAIGVDSGQEISISQCNFNGYVRQAVHLEDYLYNVSVTDCTFEGCRWSITIAHASSGQVLIAHNRIVGRLSVSLDSDPSGYADPSGTIDNNDFGIYCTNPLSTSSATGIIITDNQISRCDVGIYAPVRRGGQAYGNTVFNCKVGILLPSNEASARTRGNRLHLCKYAFWATSGVMGRNAIEDCTNIVYGRTGPLVFLDGFVFRKQVTAIAGSTTVDWPILAVSRIANAKIGVYARSTSNWAAGGVSADYDGTTLTTTRNNYVASGIIAISGTPSVVTGGVFGLRIQNADATSKDVEVEAEASGTFVMS